MHRATFAFELLEWSYAAAGTQNRLTQAPVIIIFWLDFIKQFADHISLHTTTANTFGVRMK